MPNLLEARHLKTLKAVRTGLEPATSCVTGRHSNQLNYRTSFQRRRKSKWFCFSVQYLIEYFLENILIHFKGFRLSLSPEQIQTYAFRF